MSDRSARRGSWLWFNTDVSAIDLIIMLVECGASRKQVNLACDGRFPSSTVSQQYSVAFHKVQADRLHKSGRQRDRDGKSKSEASEMNISKLVRDMARTGKTEGQIRLACAGLASENLIGVALCNARKDGLLPSRKRDSIKQYEAKRATLLHLLDLKRAQHSPKKTEFKVLPDADIATAYQRTPRTSFSYCGSSSAMCAEAAG